MQRSAGVQRLRVTFSWRSIEVRPGVNDFGSYDRYVLDAARHGITFLPILFDPPDFRSSRPARGAKRGTYPPRRTAAMGGWAAELVDRYGRGGSLWREHPEVRPRPITSWQVWNEPNLPVYWPSGPNARRYVNLLRAVGSAIKKRDRKAEIVTAGLPPSKLSGAVPLQKFIAKMYAAGGRTAFDTLAINSYAVDAKSLGKLLRDTRSLMNRRGGRAQKIWVTELGWCDKGPRSRFCVGKKRQARNITESIRLLRQQRTRLKLRGFVYFSWRDGRPYAPLFKNLWGLHTGLLTVKGKRKPAYNAFVRAVRPLTR
jgi:polysaccharide biosynthesis protein PslG